MRYYEIIATKQGTTLVNRYLPDGRTYTKYLPVENNIKVYTQLLLAFKNKPVKVELLQTGWILIQKTEEDKEMEDVAKKVVDEILGTEFEGLKSKVDVEMEFLKKSGYMVKMMVKEA